jgi:outer membrane protein OmpA-like peptidoglycan-associated protein
MILGGLPACSSSQQATSGSQETAKPVPPPPPPPPAAPEPPPPPPPAPEPPPPPPPPPVQEMAPEAAAAPAAEDPLAWAAGLVDVHFDYDKSAIRKSEHDKLAAAVSLLKADNKRKVVVEGHCDERGTAGYNLAPGESGQTLSDGPRRLRFADPNHQLREGAAALHRAERGLLSAKPPRAFRGAIASGLLEGGE